MKIYAHLWQYFCEFFLQREIFRTKLVEKSKQILCSTIFSPENPNLYETMWKAVVQQDRPQMAIQYGAFAFHAGWLRPQTHAKNM
jgi:hypothetical protein